MGRVRILKSPTDQFEQGEVLATTVTSPAWTPLFIGAAGIILQIGGVLQHGALCAREYGKPAVSNIDVHNLLKSGIMVTVDGNKGTVTILEEN
jgi:phosphoenolpyruvate synthase/pyruvate phosphate dikinase